MRVSTASARLSNGSDRNFFSRTRHADARKRPGTRSCSCRHASSDATAPVARTRVLCVRLSRRDVNRIKRASRAMFSNSSESGSGRLAARGRGHRTGRARYAPARCESLHKPSLRSLHPLRPPRDARPEHPQPVPLTIGAIPLLRRLLSFGLRWRRSAQRGGSLSAAARCGPSLGCDAACGG